MTLLFDISGGEFLLVLVFVLMFFGSKGIPEMARAAGRFMRQVRDASNEVQREIQRGADEVRRTAMEQQRKVTSMVEEPPVPPTPPEKPAKDPG
ncbi:MAG: twin-arginine translocase TatA/TatE family subunit [Flavobacteriales bacterium]|nr:twin-arginine translocase TatA/TatE family subunit [Flavobacteriales bacterium]